MRYVRYAHAGEKRWGILLSDELIQPLNAAPYAAGEPRGAPIPLGAVRLLVPCVPSKIVAVGKNYLDHIAELDSDNSRPENPILFLKPPTALLDPDTALRLPPAEITARVDYEGELALVIGKEAKDLEPDKIGEYVLGYTILNDVTARDLQQKDGQWTRAKGMDGFCPVGPVLTDEIDPTAVRLRTRLNGKIVQDASTSQMIWPVAELLSFITRHITLLPGDLVATGTPSGIGPMQSGDRVEISIEGIGCLRTTIA